MFQVGDKVKFKVGNAVQLTYADRVERDYIKPGDTGTIEAVNDLGYLVYVDMPDHKSVRLLTEEQVNTVLEKVD